jgi:sulfide:quinone oxidoreductase
LITARNKTIISVIETSLAKVGTMLSEQQTIKKTTDFIQLDDDFWLAGCLDEDDIARAAMNGFGTIINILPEDDELCQLSDRQARTTSHAYEMGYHHMPIYGHELDDETVARDFGALIRATKGPKLVYCRTGMRCAFLWGMIHVSDLGVAQIMEQTRMAGFDLSLIEDSLHLMARASSPLITLSAVA